MINTESQSARTFVTDQGADKLWDVTSPYECVVATMLRQDGAASVYVGTYGYWLNPLYRYFEPADDVLPAWHADMVAHFAEHTSYDAGRQVPGQAILDYLDAHYPEVTHA